jgi:alpha/beta superfamily hydrolase
MTMLEWLESSRTTNVIWLESFSFGSVSLAT